MNSILNMPISSDSELTASAVAGQRDAFAQIVSRYQSLICSLAYSATGSLSQSEDLAQETFIAAWKGLPTLRQPEKLRPWLCGIARNIIAGAMRIRKHEPANTAESIEAATDLPSPESLPVDRAISSEEEGILWRSLEHIPQIYREPIILFYREGQSIESVAQALELSEEAVKQRLSRGRKLLKMEVEAFVESALRQSAPGREFTSAVLAGLPVLSLSASVSTIGASASKGSVIVKTGSLASLIAGMLTPILGALGGILSLIGIIKSARSPQERALWIKSTVIFLCLFAFGPVGMHWATIRAHNEHLSVAIFFVMFLGQVSVIVTASILVNRLRERIQIEEGRVPEKPDCRLPFGSPESKGFKWIMYAYLFGITFSNPFATLTIWAAKAHDTLYLLSMLSILAATFMLLRRVFIGKPEHALNVICAIEVADFALLLITLHLRWQRWTGQSPWQLHSGASIPLVVGFLLFAFFPIVLLIKRIRQAPGKFHQ